MSLECINCEYADTGDRIVDGGIEKCYCNYHRGYVRLYGKDCGHYQGPGKDKPGDCFLTSACVDFFGKADDCVELTTLRKFRDTYMKSTEQGKKLVEEYYLIGPKIVDGINKSDKKAYYYGYINGVVDKCVNLIEKEENAQTMEEYKSMVLFLKKEFNA